jgi:hypothetical protein
MLRLILKISFLRQKRHIRFNCKTNFLVSKLDRDLNLCLLSLNLRVKRSVELIHGTVSVNM